MLEVKARGTPSPSFQWYKNDVLYERATSNTFKFESAIIEDSAQYHCLLKNQHAEIQTRKVKVQVFNKETVVTVKVTITSYDSVKKCYNFDSDNFEELASRATSERVVVTKITGASQNVTLCEVTACTRNPCLHDGVCSELSDGGYECRCKPEWTGRNCGEDINECQLANMCNNGTCINKNGTFSCVCPASNTGRRCEFQANACKPSPCAADENCVPRESLETRFACTKKSDEVTLVVDSKDLLKWTKDKKYLLEHLLNQLLKTNQGGTTTLFKRRRRRNTAIAHQQQLRLRRASDQTMQIGDCVLHILNSAIVNTTKTEVKLALDFPNHNGTIDTGPILKQICGILFSGEDSSTVVEQCGRTGEMEKKKVSTVDYRERSLYSLHTQPRRCQDRKEVGVKIEKPYGNSRTGIYSLSISIDRR